MYVFASQNLNCVRVVCNHRLTLWYNICWSSNLLEHMGGRTSRDYVCLVKQKLFLHSLSYSVNIRTISVDNVSLQNEWNHFSSYACTYSLILRLICGETSKEVCYFSPFFAWMHKSYLTWRFLFIQCQVMKNVPSITSHR